MFKNMKQFTGSWEEVKQKLDDSNTIVYQTKLIDYVEDKSKIIYQYKIYDENIVRKD